MGWLGNGDGEQETTTPPDFGTVDVEDIADASGKCDPENATRTVRETKDPPHGDWAETNRWFEAGLPVVINSNPPLNEPSTAYITRQRTKFYKCQKQKCSNGQWVADGDPEDCNTTQTEKLKMTAGGVAFILWTHDQVDGAMASNDFDTIDSSES